MKRILALFALVLTLMSGGSLSAAEDISALTDAEVRKLLIERLDDTEAKPDPAFNPAMVAWKFQRNFTKVKKAAGKIFGSYDKLPALPGRWWKKMTNKREGRLWRRLLLGSLPLRFFDAECGAVGRANKRQNHAPGFCLVSSWSKALAFWCSVLLRRRYSLSSPQMTAVTERCSSSFLPRR